MHGLFTNIKFLYEKTGNTNLDKYFFIFKVQNYYNQYNRFFKYLNNNELAYIAEILNKIIYSDFISKEDKSSILAIKTLIFKKVETQEDWFKFIIIKLNIMYHILKNIVNKILKLF